MAPDWHREDIKAAVRKTGTTLVELALRNGFTETTVRKALDRPSPRAEAIIARQLGMSPTAIWPSRYDQAGNPLSHRKHGDADSARQRQNKRAA